MRGTLRAYLSWGEYDNGQPALEAMTLMCGRAEKGNLLG
jgi:hypothetical protein